MGEKRKDTDWRTRKRIKEHRRKGKGKEIMEKGEKTIYKNKEGRGMKKKKIQGSR